MNYLLQKAWITYKSIALVENTNKCLSLLGKNQLTEMKPKKIDFQVFLEFTYTNLNKAFFL